MKKKYKCTKCSVEVVSTAGMIANWHYLTTGHHQYKEIKK